MTRRRITTAVLFVVMLTIPTVLGAIPFKIYTPVGVVSTQVPEAQARARNTAQNRLRALRVPTNHANFTQSFGPNRHAYTINVRENIATVGIQPTRGNAQQRVRHVIDTRRDNGTWNNGRWTAWRTGNRANNRINVGVAQGQERRLRIAVRDRSGNVRTYSVNLRRASNNTFASGLFHNTGSLAGAFNRNAGAHTLNLPAGTGAVTVGKNRAQANAMMRFQVGNGAWSGWQRANLRPQVSVAQGATVPVRFQIRGAWSDVAASPLRTRQYTVNVTRARPVVAPPAQTPTPQPPTPPANNIVTTTGGWQHLPANPWMEFNLARSEFRITGTERWDQAAELFRLVNEHRAAHGLEPFIHSPALSAGAVQRAGDNAVHFSHTRPNGHDSTTLGIGGENLVGGLQAATILERWKNSPGHNARLLQNNEVLTGRGAKAYVGLAVFQTSAGGANAVLTTLYSFEDLSGGAVEIGTGSRSAVLTVPWDRNYFLNNGAANNFIEWTPASLDLLWAAGVRP
ncbi:MAG: CAP domain-containing protein [Coriobacteriia bacterium]|nr:CAP domain-containing protein [Coriobacteriia bacterium]MCL2537724.1 CAP domain-containing protein [Coriobacteriia bacterium]